jgi:hypothetical protein
MNYKKMTFRASMLGFDGFLFIIIIKSFFYNCNPN